MGLPSLHGGSKVRRPKRSAIVRYLSRYVPLFILPRYAALPSRLRARYCAFPVCAKCSLLPDSRNVHLLGGRYRTIAG